MTRDKRDSKIEGVRGGCSRLPSLFVYNGGRGMGREQTENLLESALMSKWMDDIVYIIIVYGIIYIHYYY